MSDQEKPRVIADKMKIGDKLVSREETVEVDAETHDVRLKDGMWRVRVTVKDDDALTTTRSLMPLSSKKGLPGLDVEIHERDKDDVTGEYGPGDLLARATLEDVVVRVDIHNVEVRMTLLPSTPLQGALVDWPDEVVLRGQHIPES